MSVVQLLCFCLLMGAFILLNFLDAHSTWLVVSRAGHRSERNPLARYFIKKMGPAWGMLWLKSFLAVLIPLMIFYFMYDPINLNWIMLGADVLFWAVVWNNYRIARRMAARQAVSPVAPAWEQL